MVVRSPSDSEEWLVQGLIFHEFLSHARRQHFTSSHFSFDDSRCKAMIEGSDAEHGLIPKVIITQSSAQSIL